MFVFSYNLIIVNCRCQRYSMRLNRANKAWQDEMSAIGSAIESKKVKKTDTH